VITNIHKHNRVGHFCNTQGNECLLWLHCRYGINNKDEILTSIEFRGKDVSNVVLIRTSDCTKDKSTLNIKQRTTQMRNTIETS